MKIKPDNNIKKIKNLFIKQFGIYAKFVFDRFFYYLKYLIVTILFLSGCSSSVPVKLGMTKSEWLSYSPNDRQILLANYKNFIKEHKNLIKINPNIDTFLEISIHGGKIKLPPFNDWTEYDPVKFNIFKDQCRDIVLHPATDKTDSTNKINKKISVNLTGCFYKDVLYLDPSHYDLAKKRGSIRINFSPLWMTGFSYKGISSSGYVRLKDVTLIITMKNL